MKHSETQPPAPTPHPVPGSWTERGTELEGTIASFTHPFHCRLRAPGLRLGSYNQGVTQRCLECRQARCLASAPPGEGWHLLSTRSGTASLRGRTAARAPLAVTLCAASPRVPSVLQSHHHLCCPKPLRCQSLKSSLVPSCILRWSVLQLFGEWVGTRHE